MNINYLTISEMKLLISLVKDEQSKERTKQSYIYDEVLTDINAKLEVMLHDKQQ